MAKASDVISVMQGWIGTDKRQIIDLYNSHKPLAQGYAVKYTDAWCDTTVSACFIKVNATDLIGGTECGVERHIQLFKKKGIWNEDGNIIPNPGDIICYNWDDPTQPNDGFADHIGIVEKIDGKNITVIEGNYNNAVQRRTIPAGWGYIRGYAQPKYEAEKQEEKNVSKTVIDVSYYQGVINWEIVKPQIDGVIIRCGYGADETAQDDKQWSRNVTECERLGIPYGVYLYSYADSDAKIQSEISHTLRLIKGHNPVIGVFYDLEENNKGWIAARAAKEWCRQINASGYKAGIYCGAYYYKAYMKGVHEAVNALWWIAGYGKNSGVPEYAYKPNPGFEYDGWQYTSVKRFNGISGGVDTSEWYVPFDAVETPSIAYRAHVQNKGWMAPVRNGEWAGTIGKSLRMEAIKITPEGMELEVTAHIQDIGDKVYKGIKKGQSSGTGSSANDPIIGTVGKSKRLEAITIKVTKNTTGKQIRYQGHVQNVGDTNVCKEGELCGTKGKSLRLEAIRIWLV